MAPLIWDYLISIPLTFCKFAPCGNSKVEQPLGIYSAVSQHYFPSVVWKTKYSCDQDVVVKFWIQKMTIEVLIETCIRIRFDRNVCFLGDENKQHHQIRCFFLPTLVRLSCFLSVDPKEQQKRTILSYRISLRILNELWNIIHNNIWSNSCEAFSASIVKRISFYSPGLSMPSRSWTRAPRCSFSLPLTVCV